MDTELAKQIHLLQQGDPQIISQLYDQYSGALFGIVVKICRSPELSEEVLQESFVKIWRNGASYDPSKGRLFTWMVRIARNTALNAIESKTERKQSKIRTIDNSVYNTVKYYAIDPEVLDLKGKVNQLDPKYRELIELIYFQGFTQKDASEHLGIPIGTVKTRVRSALSLLRDIYNDLGKTSFSVLIYCIMVVVNLL